jgi:hypothetical protein
MTDVAGLSGLMIKDALVWTDDVVGMVLGGELYTSLMLT